MVEKQKKFNFQAYIKLKRCTKKKQRQNNFITCIEWFSSKNSVKSYGNTE